MERKGNSHRTQEHKMSHVNLFRVLIEYFVKTPLFMYASKARWNDTTCQFCLISLPLRTQKCIYPFLFFKLGKRQSLSDKHIKAANKRQTSFNKLVRIGGIGARDSSKRLVMEWRILCFCLISHFMVNSKQDWQSDLLSKQSEVSAKGKTPAKWCSGVEMHLPNKRASQSRAAQKTNNFRDLLRLMPGKITTKQSARLHVISMFSLP